MKFFGFVVHSLLEYLHKKTILYHLYFVKFVSNGGPTALGYWRSIHSLLKHIFHCENPLFPPFTLLKSSASSLKMPLLKEILKEEELGVWALDEKTVDFLWKRLLQERPDSIIECGSGISSLFLAAYSKLCSSNLLHSRKIFSLEQNLPTKEKIEDKLKKFGLMNHIDIVHSPITEKGIYKLDGTALQKRTGALRADWLLIDGPAGPPSGCRIWVLPTLVPFCRPGTRFFLDDAFRADELEILNTWKHWPGVVVEGIYPIGKGLGSGRLTDPQKLSDWNG